MRKRQNAVLAAIAGFGHTCSVWTCVSSVQLYAQSGRVIGTPCVFFSPCSWWRSFAHGKNSKCFAWSRSCVSFCIWIVDPRTCDLPCSSIGLCLVQVRHQFFTSRFTWFPDAHDFHGTQQDAGSEPCLLTTQAAKTTHALCMKHEGASRSSIATWTAISPSLRHIETRLGKQKIMASCRRRKMPAQQQWM